MKVFEPADFDKMQSQIQELEEAYFHPQTSDENLKLVFKKIEQLYQILDTSTLDRALARKNKNLRKLGLR